MLSETLPCLLNKHALMRVLKTNCKNASRPCEGTALVLKCDVNRGGMAHAPLLPHHCRGTVTLKGVHLMEMKGNEPLAKANPPAFTSVM